MEKDHVPSLFHGNLVRLAAVDSGEIPVFLKWAENPDYMRQLDTDYVRPQQVQDIQQMFSPDPAGRSVLFFIRTLSEDRLIGFIALHSIEWNNQSGECSIGIGEIDYQGKGYGSDALILLLRYAFEELNLYRVSLTVIANNVRAIKAYQKVGFREEGRLRQAVHRDGVRTDLIWMGILQPEWQAQYRINEG